MKTLVAYFSATGTTARQAEKLADKLGADLHEIKPETAYTAADLNWQDKQARSTVESGDPASRPALADKSFDASDYEDVYIGFPIWWYTVPHIINSFIESGDFAGKNIHLFATSGGSNIKKALADLKAAYPDLNFVDGQMMN